ncbi:MULTISPECIES: hypothetical protein [unclassified Janibacter]|uniref:hypothetical protein n=1 Tax=unclassified Janibacter TaxID=2649294 RepID=UPI003CFBF3B1
MTTTAALSAPRARRLGLGLALALTLSGCGVLSPVQTDVVYDAGDGVSLDLGDVALRNLVLVTPDGPYPVLNATKTANPKVDATVSGAAANTGDKDVDLTFTTESGAEASATLPAGKTIQLSADGELVTLTGVSGSIGDTVTVTVDAGGSASGVKVPLLPATGYYEDYAPKTK